MDINENLMVHGFEIFFKIVFMAIFSGSDSSGSFSEAGVYEFLKYKNLPNG